MDRLSLEQDRRTLDAVVRNLEILGEAAKHIPEPMRIRYGSVPWRQIAGLRDVIIHQYFAVDLDIVWQVLVEKLGPLERELRQILDDLKSDPGGHV